MINRRAEFRRAERRPHKRLIGVAVLVMAAVFVPLAAFSPAVSANPTATFSLNRVSGPTGTVVVLTSVTPCVAPPGVTNWSVDGIVNYTDDRAYPYQKTGGPPATQPGGQLFAASVMDNGSWSASFVAGAQFLADQTNGLWPLTGPAQISITCEGNGQSVTYVPADFDLTTSGQGYWLLGTEAPGVSCTKCGLQAGEPPRLKPVYVNSFGDANFLGPINPRNWSAPLVGIAADQVDGTGYWLAGADGGVDTYGVANFYGSVPALGIKIRNVVGIAASPDAGGYWLVGADGGVYSFGDAHFEGSLPSEHISPAQPIVGMAASSGSGYWLVGADGGVYSFGGAQFYGSLPGAHITPARPIVGIVAVPGGHGYWLMGADGGVYSFGDAHFYGSLPGKHISPVQPIVGMATSDAGGYWLAGADGGVFSFGDAPFRGSCAGGLCRDTAGQPGRFVGIVGTPATTADG